jgi:7-cyano-7-deazaguanine synthase
MESWQRQAVAVLTSGGPDSAVLVGELAAMSPSVTPIYVRFGMLWEDAEEAALRRFLAALGQPAISQLKVFAMQIAAVYGPHWSTTGQDTPDRDSPDAAVFLPGRNLLLLAQAAVWCHLQKIPTLAMGLLKGNPFPDATEVFFRHYQASINSALGGHLRIVRPYQTLSKIDVLRRGARLPLSETWSCIRPVDGRHCGQCNKCAERQKAFKAAGIVDTTQYKLVVRSS